jgi:putative flavoprotein involved in K+ transport
LWGGGQAGLSMSYCLKERGIDHLVLEKSRMGEAWRSQRWDSFCLVTPNWQCTLPGFPYQGGDPDGFMVKEDIVKYLEDYAAFFQPPLREGVSVQRVSRNADGKFEINTDHGDFTADQVVVATGGYHTASIPLMSGRFPSSLTQLHSSAYKNPDQLQPGSVLIVGTGQSGCQIAEDLHLAGREVHLCVGGAPRTARRYRGRDVVAWLHDMGYYEKPIHEHPQKERVRAKANHYVTGRDGGRDIDLRRFALEGMKLYGRLQSVEGPSLTFSPDLRKNLDHADTVSESIKTTIDNHIAAHGIDAPEEARYVPLWQPPDPEPDTLDWQQAGIRNVIWSMGFRTNYSWLEVPVFDGKGYPAHQRGITPIPGLYFLGLPWQYTWGSGRFSGVAADARFLMETITARHAPGPALPPPDRILNEWALGS